MSTYIHKKKKTTTPPISEMLLFMLLINDQSLVECIANYPILFGVKSQVHLHGCT